jgi:hypothetical protein
MRIEIRSQKPGEPWPDGQAWTIPDQTTLKAICADLTREEMQDIIRWAGTTPRAAHSVAERIEAVLKRRGDDVLLVKREVVKVRRMGKGTAAQEKFVALLTREQGSLQALQYACPALSKEDAEEVSARMTGSPLHERAIIDAIRDHFAEMGPVEIMVVDDPGQ